MPDHFFYSACSRRPASPWRDVLALIELVKSGNQSLWLSKDAELRRLLLLQTYRRMFLRGLIRSVRFVDGGMERCWSLGVPSCLRYRLALLFIARHSGVSACTMIIIYTICPDLCALHHNIGFQYLLLKMYAYLMILYMYILVTDFRLVLECSCVTLF